MTTMKWKSEFVEQGHVQTRRQDLLKVLDLRGLRPTEEERARVGSSTDLAQLDQWFERSLTAATAAEVFTD